MLIDELYNVMDMLDDVQDPKAGDIYHYINSMDTGIERRGSSPITKSDSKYLKSLKTR